MRILHISAECYPAAKAGGLGDVVGALPKYLTKAGHQAGVIIPKYSLKWINNQQFETVHHGTVRLHHDYYPFTIEQVQNKDLGYPLFVANIPGKFDRPGIYADPSGWGYGDDVERWLCFQQAVLIWLTAFKSEDRPQVLHCHDHHTGLIPFMVKHCQDYKALANIPTVFTIHNGVYHGAYSWEKMYLLPYFDAHARDLLDWGNTINPLATGIKCCWRLTTVSPSYFEELKHKSNGLESLVTHEQRKAIGILNGIDAQVWDPKADSYIAKKMRGKQVTKFKEDNKKVLLERFNIRPDVPIITFIGRLVNEKGADLIPDLVARFLHSGQQAAFIILGTGDPRLHDKFRALTHQFPGYVDAALEYNEGLAHQLYAGSDFLFMPSRVEPCGLNQMYAMRYGTIPIVRTVGGLRDTVLDLSEDGCRGVRFDHFSLDDAYIALYRSAEFYKNPDQVKLLRERIMNLDFSWEHAAKNYERIYETLG